MAVEAALELPQEEECCLLCVRRDSTSFRSRCDYVLRDSVKRAHRFGVAGIETKATRSSTADKPDNLKLGFARGTGSSPG